MSKLVVIDGNNMAFRVYWVHRRLAHKGTPTGLIYGFFQSLITLKKKYPDHLFVVVWDAPGKNRRHHETQQAVTDGIVPSAYKANRKKDERHAEIYEAINDQLDVLEDGLKKSRILQVSLVGYEGDDVVYSYAMQNSEHGGETVVVSADSDFYQVLKDDSVKLFDPMKKEMWTRERFVVEFGFNPEHWVDVRALQGKPADNVFGAVDWGKVTSRKYVQQYGDVEAIVDAIKAKSKPTKREQSLLDSLPRVWLAKSIKQMDRVPSAQLPKTRICHATNEAELRQYFLDFGFASLLHDTRRLV